MTSPLELCARNDLPAVVRGAVQGTRLGKGIGIEAELANDAALIHLRALDDFLTGTGSNVKDVFAHHYVVGWTSNHRLAQPLRRRVNTQVAHLSLDRLQMTTTLAAHVEYADVILAWFADFIRQVPQEERAWFQVAHDHLCQHIYANGKPLPDPWSAVA